MGMTGQRVSLAAGEPEAGPWRADQLAVVAATVMRSGYGNDADHDPVVLAVDGRSSSGKTTLPARLQDVVGRAVSYRPPRWDDRQRPGAIEVPAGCRLLITEGVGAARDQRPWEHAGLVACGTPQIPFDPATELVVAPPARM